MRLIAATAAKIGLKRSGGAVACADLIIWHFNMEVPRGAGASSTPPNAESGIEGRNTLEKRYSRASR